MQANVVLKILLAVLANHVWYASTEVATTFALARQPEPTEANAEPISALGGAAPGNGTTQGTTSNKSDDDSGPSKAALYIGVASGAFLLSALVTCIVMLRRYRRKQAQLAETKESEAIQKRMSVLEAHGHTADITSMRNRERKASFSPRPSVSHMSAHSARNSPVMGTASSRSLYTSLPGQLEPVALMPGSPNQRHGSIRSTHGSPQSSPQHVIPGAQVPVSYGAGYGPSPLFLDPNAPYMYAAPSPGMMAQPNIMVASPGLIPAPPSPSTRSKHGKHHRPSKHREREGSHSSRSSSPMPVVPQ